MMKSDRQLMCFVEELSSNSKFRFYQDNQTETISLADDLANSHLKDVSNIDILFFKTDGNRILLILNLGVLIWHLVTQGFEEGCFSSFLSLNDCFAFIALCLHFKPCIYYFLWPTCDEHCKF